MPLPSAFRAVSFHDLPGWAEDSLSPAYAAFRRSAFQVLAKPYRTGSLGIVCEAFADAFEEARGLDTLTDAAARDFFERHFRPVHIPGAEGGHGFVTGFYEPEVEASPVRTDRFGVPLLARPADLVDIDDANRPAGMDPYLAFGRNTPDGLQEYFDRKAIEQGALSGQGLEIAWLADPVDAFFIHVQGAARLRMTDGTLRRLTYAAKSGQNFSGPGRILVNLGEIPLEKVIMQSIRAWFSENPHRINEILWQNRSYIFFRETPIGDPELGPVAAAKVQLTPGRSIAVDRLFHTFATPFFIDAPSLTAFDGMPFRRLMIAQDTGSAIVGQARGDLFAGSGHDAGEIAGGIRHEADFYALVPRVLAGEAA